MCGIAGKICFGGSQVSEREMASMASKIAHRGPDDEGIFISQDKRVGLVSRRLAVIDLSPNGHMPMMYLNRYVITYNGEVYNFNEEKKLLEKEGYTFKSNSDTEVILALYDKYGTDCLKHLRGMFAFAIYDRAKNIIFAARDRLGKKPFKYFSNSQVFVFASELKAIITQEEIKVKPDFVAINQYLTFGYVPSPLTGFSEIKKLEPGHFLMIDIKTGNIRKEKYWFPDFSQKLFLPESEWKKRIIATLEESVKLRMISDVPLGVFLSGGVDSSAIVAMMAGNSNAPVKTFTIGFKDEIHDERKYAQRIADLYKTDHTELIVEPESVDILLDLVKQFEEPFANSSFILSYLVSKMARKKVTVTLNGDGGDENFGGYESRMFRLARDVRADKAAPILNLSIPLMKMLGKERIVRYLIKRKTPLADRYLSYNCYFEDVQNSLLVRKKFMEANTPDPRDRALYYDLTQYFPDELLVKSDLSSMYVSLEGRSPFADHVLTELACKIPFDLKVKGKTAKYILKKALEDFVPKENLYREKRGFSVPLGKWFTGDLKKYAQSKVLAKNSFVGKLFEREAIENLLESHSVQNDMGLKLWNLLALEMWFKSYFG